MFRTTHCGEIAKVKFRNEEPIVSVSIYSEIDNDVAEYVEAEVSKAISSRQPFLPVIINSNGGCVYALFSIIETLRSASEHLEVVTVVPGFAASAAVGIFCCGNRRYISPSGRLMVHHANLTNHSTMSVREIQIESNELKMLNETMFSMMGEFTLNDPSYYRKLVSNNGDHDLYLSSHDALKHSLATAIGIPRFESTVQIKRTIVEPNRAIVRKQLQAISASAVGKKKKETKKKKKEKTARTEYAVEKIGN